MIYSLTYSFSYLQKKLCHIFQLHSKHKETDKHSQPLLSLFNMKRFFQKASLKVSPLSKKQQKNGQSQQPPNHTIGIELSLFKIYVMNQFNQEIVPQNLKDVVELLSITHVNQKLYQTFQLYLFVYAAMNHAMWIEQCNSIAGNATSGKLINRKAKTLSQILNINIDAPILNKKDLRWCALEYATIMLPKSKCLMQQDHNQYIVIYSSLQR